MIFCKMCTVDERWIVVGLGCGLSHLIGKITVYQEGEPRILFLIMI